MISRKPGNNKLAIVLYTLIVTVGGIMTFFDLPHDRCAPNRVDDVRHVYSLFPFHLQRRIRHVCGGVWIWETPWLPSAENLARALTGP